jgi:dihydrofolate synthase / folylpolyglutamate synthase
MTYPEAIQFLYGLRWFGTKLGLEQTERLAALAGNPHHRLRFIHVAGTNGKGSTCAMLESVYRAAGLRVGLFTSPHLVAFSERIQVNRCLIPEEDVVRLVAEIKPLLQQFGPEEHPTFFEVVTIMALSYFAEQACDLVIWETGLGGRLDATNIVTPLASVITNIQYDHQKWLGETLTSIASEKAGIIKPGVPALTAAEEPEALKVIVARAAGLGSPLTTVTRDQANDPVLATVQLPLLGEHQRLNAALTVATVRQLCPLLPVSDDQIKLGLESVQWSGRLQVCTRGNARQVVLDGAHNIAGVRTLVSALRQYFPGRTATLILGILDDKDWPEMCRLLAPLGSRILLVPVHSDRTAQPHGLATICTQANPAAAVLEFASLEQALQHSREDPLVVIAGSLYLVGEALEVLNLSPTSPSERALNEWGSAPSQARK